MSLSYSPLNIVACNVSLHNQLSKMKPIIDK